MNRPSPPVKGALHHNFALALHRQHKNEEALEHFAHATALDPNLPFTDAIRAEILQGLKRYDEAVEVSRQMIARDLANPDWPQIPQRVALSPGAQRGISQIL